MLFSLPCHLIFSPQLFFFYIFWAAAIGKYLCKGVRLNSPLFHFWFYFIFPPILDIFMGWKWKKILPLNRIHAPFVKPSVGRWVSIQIPWPVTFTIEIESKGIPNSSHLHVWKRLCTPAEFCMIKAICLALALSLSLCVCCVYMMECGTWLLSDLHERQPSTLPPPMIIDLLSSASLSYSH